MSIRDFAHAALAASIVLIAVGCGSPTDPVATASSPGSTASSDGTLHVNPSAALLGVGDTTHLSALAFPTTAVTWLSNNAAVATIDSTGLVTAVGAGSALMTASDGTRQATASITVNAAATLATPVCVPTGDGICRYVDARAGDDANPGTSTQPYRTLGMAASVVNPGDVVIVRDGTYYGTSGDAILPITRGGTAGKLVVFKAEHQWGAVLDGQKNAFATGVKYRASYVRVEGFDVHDVNHYGFDLGWDLTGVQAAGNHVHHVGRYCTGTTSGLSAFTVDDDDVVIEGNVVHDIGRYGPGEGGCTPPTPYYQNNDHGIYLSSGTNIIIRNNVFYDLTHGWAIHRYNLEYESVDRVYIVNNTFAFPNPYRDGQIVIAGPFKNSLIANNIFYQPRGAGILFNPDGPMTNVRVTNNVTSGGPVSTGSSSGATVSANLDWTDPRLADPSDLDFHLQSGSPAIGVGLALPYVSNDFVGAVRNTNDAGAYRF